jgi:hypothetical protein
MTGGWSALSQPALGDGAGQPPPGVAWQKAEQDADIVHVPWTGGGQESSDAAAR